MTVGLLFSALAHHGNSFALGQFLKQPQGELLSVVFDGAIAPVNRAAFEQFLSVSPAELGPRDLLRTTIPGSLRKPRKFFCLSVYCFLL
jgi:hypothetical protein